MNFFKKAFLTAMIPFVAFWMLVTRDNKEIPLLLNDIYKDMKNK